MAQANLEDMAYVLKGLQDYQTATGDKTFQPSIVKLQHRVAEQFLHQQQWRYGQSANLPIHQQKAMLKDTQIPSPSALVSCPHPETLDPKALLDNPIAYASYVGALNCIAGSNPVK